MSRIQVSHLTFCYEGSYDNIFEDVSFTLDTDWKLGFIGRNGKGKTTFLNLLLGKYEYEGKISALAELEYFPFPVSEQERKKNTIDMIEAIFPDYEFWMICRELSLLQMDADVLYRPYYTLSGGEQVKVMLSVLFSRENRFLLMDEPTNHLDQESRDVIHEYLKKKKGFLLVSHDRELLNDCVDHILVLNRANIEVFQGNFDTWWENKRRQDAYELSENEKLKKDIRRLKEAARQTRSWGDQVEATKIGAGSEKYEKCIDTRAFVGEKSRRMQQRRKNLERRQNAELEEKSKLLKNLERREELKLFPLSHQKELLVQLDQICFGYGEKRILDGFSMNISNGERISLEGHNGCGKSTVLKIIMEQLKPENGMLYKAGGLRISYVPQDTSFLQGFLSDYAKKCKIEESLFMTLLRKLDFERVQFEKDMKDYSEGQKKKVLIARSLCEQAHLYIWDEPLNYIDVFSRMQIEELILKYQPTLLFVEHDKLFARHIGAKHVMMD